MDVNLESAASVTVCLLFSAWLALSLASSLFPRLGHPWGIACTSCFGDKSCWNSSLLNFHICGPCLFSSGLLLLVHCMLVNVLCMFLCAKIIGLEPNCGGPNGKRAIKDDSSLLVVAQGLSILTLSASRD